MTTIRIFVTGDIHFHEPMGREEQERYIDHILAECPDVDLALFAGDFVRPAHASKAAPWERNAIRRLVAGVAAKSQNGAIAIRGNHDVPGDLDHLSDLPGVGYYDSAQPTTAGQTSVFILPWLDTVDGTEVSDVLAGFRDSVVPGKPAILVMHGAVAGSVKENGQPLVTHEFQIPPGWVDGFDVVFASHYHCAQTTQLESGTTLVLPGSPWPHAVNEGRQQGKGPQIWTLTRQGDGRWAAAHEKTIVVPYAPRFAFTLAWSDESKQLAWPDQTPWMGLTPTNGHRSPLIPTPSMLAGARAVVRVVRPSSAKACTPASEIEAEFLSAGCVECKVDVVPTYTPAPPRIPEINAETLSLPDMIRMVRKQENRPIPEEEEPRYFEELSACTKGGHNALAH